MLGSRVSRTCGTAMSANVASAMRSPFQLSVFVRVRTHCIARCQRSVPMSRTRIDVDPSISRTMSTPGLRTMAVMPCGLDEREDGERQRGDERQPERQLADRAEALAHGNQPRGAVLAGIGAPADHLRRTTARSSTAGAASSHKYSGSPKRSDPKSINRSIALSPAYLSIRASASLQRRFRPPAPGSA